MSNKCICSNPLRFDRSRYMTNRWKARSCCGCEYLHIGRRVDHNHCDYAHDDSWIEPDKKCANFKLKPQCQPKEPTHKKEKWCLSCHMRDIALDRIKSLRDRLENAELLCRTYKSDLRR